MINFYFCIDSTHSHNTVLIPLILPAVVFSLYSFALSHVKLALLLQFLDLSLNSVSIKTVSCTFKR